MVKCLHAKLLYIEVIAQSQCYWDPAAISFPVTPFKRKAGYCTASEKRF